MATDLSVAERTRTIVRMKDAYTLTVGIETHAELNTNSKMFCGCKNAPHAEEANALTCPVCLAHPGTLPVPNYAAIEKLLMVGAAIDGNFATYSEFDRKNYFYPDIPKAYQISQYAFPFVTGGTLADVAITRIHLEEDTARSQHDKGDESLIDFNRAGVPLMELVTEPVIHSAEQARIFAEELQLLLRTLGVSDANMEKGEMRVEANISVSKTDTLGTKVEVKNLNSFKSVQAAIEYEQKRQIELLESGDKIIQETRGWDENKSKTFSQRAKESANDYRYFPDPDISKLSIPTEPKFSKSRIKEISQELPLEKRLKYTNLGMPSNQIEVIIADQNLDKILERVLAETNNQAVIKLASNYIASDVKALLSESATGIADKSICNFVTLISMAEAGEINSRVAKDMLLAVLFDEVEPRAHAQANNLLQQSNESDLLPMVVQIVTDNPEVVAEYKNGKESALQFLVGQGMKASKGSANPQLLKELLQTQIK